MIVRFELDTNLQNDRETLDKVLSGLAPKALVIEPVLAPQVHVPANSIPQLAQAQATVTVGAAPTFSDEDVANATRELVSTLGPAEGVRQAREVLQQFGIERARDLPVEKREEYIAVTKKIVTDHKAKVQS